jgi:cytochrome c biogenesis protein CcmG/thiol:disulfide interchange protein DsbE
MKFAVPLVLFVVLIGFLGVGLWRDPHLVPSPLIDRAAPVFQLARLDEPNHSFSPQELLGKVWLLNTWASWCVSCREEHPLLLALSKADIIPIYGLNYKDHRADALKWLTEMGDPYVLNVQDTNGRVGIDYGVYGVPETYLIDKAGVIRYKQIGPLTLKTLEVTILPMIQNLNRGVQP